jgi:hypothetical protein
MLIKTYMYEVSNKDSNLKAITDVTIFPFSED